MSAPRVIASDLILAGWLPPHRAADVLGISPRQLGQRVRKQEIRRIRARDLDRRLKVEPMEIEGSKDLDWDAARIAWRSIGTQIEIASGMTPEDVAGHAERVQAICRRMVELAASLKIEVPTAELHTAIRDANPAPGVVSDVEVVRMLIKERQELLNEIAASVPPECLAEAVGKPQGVPSETARQVPAEPAPNYAEPRAYYGDCIECERELCPRCEQCHQRGCLEAVRNCTAEPPGDLRAALDSLVAVISAGPTAWLRCPDLAWVYGVIVGLSETDLEELQISFGWPSDAIAVIAKHYAAVADARRAE